MQIVNDLVGTIQIIAISVIAILAILGALGFYQVLRKIISALFNISNKSISLLLFHILHTSFIKMHSLFEHPCRSRTI